MTARLLKSAAGLACALAALLMAFAVEEGGGHFPCLVTNAYAASSADTWDGTADTSWYDANPSADAFTLDSAEDLAGLSKLTNEDGVVFTGKTVALATDVDMAGFGWTAISENGNNSTISSFSGTFDGQHHVVKNLSNAPDAEKRMGLFGTVHEATIKNVIIEDANVALPAESTRLQVGTLVSWASSSAVENCAASGTLQSATDSIIGGLIGQCTGGTVVSGCSSNVDVIATYPPGEIGDSSPVVGGLVGQWENAADSSIIKNCIFSGSLAVASNQAGCGGILGACFDFDGAPGVVIDTCVAAPSSITCGSSENVTYIAAVDEDATVKNCLWPDEPYAAVVSLIVDWDQGIATADPNFDQSACGHAVADFGASEVAAELNAASPDGAVWSEGLFGLPVLAWQTYAIPADYAKVREAVAEAEQVDRSLYTAESLEALDEAVGSVPEGLSKNEQSVVNAKATEIENALAALERLADYTAVDAAIDKAEAVDRALYTEGSLATLDEALGSVAYGYGETRQTEVDAMAAAVEKALASLELLPKPGDESTEPGEGDDPEKPGDAGEGGDPAESEENDNPEKPEAASTKGSALSATSDPIALSVGFIAFAASASAPIALIARKRTRA